MKNILSQIVSSPIGAFAVLSIAAFLEVSGDACFQTGLYRAPATTRALWFLAATLILGVYGLFVNLPQWDFGKLLGMYVVLFFLIAQIVAKVRFHQSPTTPIWAGGALIVAGGLVITFWKA